MLRQQGIHDKLEYVQKMSVRVRIKWERVAGGSQGQGGIRERVAAHVLTGHSFRHNTNLRRDQEQLCGIALPEYQLFKNYNETRRESAIQVHVAFQIEIKRRELLGFHFLFHYLFLIWEKWYLFSKAQLSHLKNGTKKSHISDLLPRLNEIIYVKNLAQCFDTKYMLKKLYSLLLCNGNCI